MKQAWPIAWRPWRSQRHCAAPPQELAHELGAAQDAYFRHSWLRHLSRPPCRYDSLAERSKAVAQGAIQKGVGSNPTAVGAIRSTGWTCSSAPAVVKSTPLAQRAGSACATFELSLCFHDTLAERFKAVAQGAIP